jgi:hypothetical protein
MGCCQAKQGIIIPFEKSSVLNSLTLREKLLIISEEVFQDFENSVNKKISLSCPRSLPELNQLLRQAVTQAMKNFEEKTQMFQEESLSKLLSLYKFYLISKCKSAEGIIRNKNDFVSFEHLNNLKRDLFEQLDQGRITRQELIETYNKSSKGTFVIRGLNEIHLLIDFPKLERLEKMKIQEDCEREQLQKDQEELAKASQKIIIPLVNEGDFSTVMSNLNPQDASFDLYSDLKFEDLENDLRPFSVFSSSIKVYPNLK